MLTAIEFQVCRFVKWTLSELHFPRPSPLHSKTQNVLINPSWHRSLAIDTAGWLPRLMGPVTCAQCFYLYAGTLVLIGFSSWFFVRQSRYLCFWLSAHAELLVVVVVVVVVVVIPDDLLSSESARLVVRWGIVRNGGISREVLSPCWQGDVMWWLKTMGRTVF